MATATHDLNELKRRMQGAIGTLKQELSGLRTGRASPSLLEPVQVDAFLVRPRARTNRHSEGRRRSPAERAEQLASGSLA